MIILYLKFECKMFVAPTAKARWLADSRLSSEKIGFNPIELQRSLGYSFSHLLTLGWIKSPPWFISIWGEFGVNVITFCHANVKCLSPQSDNHDLASLSLHLQHYQIVSGLDYWSIKTNKTASMFLLILTLLYIPTIAFPCMRDKSTI